MNLEFSKQLIQIIEPERVLLDEPMKQHTTFRVGGPADYFVVPRTNAEVEHVVMLCKKENLPYYILGNGSNLLVGDLGYRGVIIQIYKEMNRIVVEGNQIRAQAGALLSKVGNAALEASLQVLNLQQVFQEQLVAL